jgi:formate hydrogenlyase transcriptional activator
MEKALPSPSEVLSLGGSAKDESGPFSSESVPDILRLISAGSPLPATLNVIARLVESQGEGFFCTIWLPDEQANYLYCAAAPSIPGFSDRSAHTCCPKRVTCD